MGATPDTPADAYELTSIGQFRPLSRKGGSVRFRSKVGRHSPGVDGLARFSFAERRSFGRDQKRRGQLMRRTLLGLVCALLVVADDVSAQAQLPQPHPASVPGALASPEGCKLDETSGLASSFARVAAMPEGDMKRQISAQMLQAAAHLAAANRDLGCAQGFADQLVAFAPQSYTSYQTRANTRLASGAFAAALEDAEKALELGRRTLSETPANPYMPNEIILAELLALNASAHSSLGAHDKAIALMTDASQIVPDPNYAGLLIGRRGLFKVVAGRYEDALKDCEGADPADMYKGSLCQIVRADAYFGLAQYDAAVLILDEMVRTQDTAVASMGQAPRPGDRFLGQIGMPQGGTQNFGGRPPSDPSAYQMAAAARAAAPLITKACRAKTRLGSLDLAAMDCARALAGDPNHAQAHFAAFELATARGDVGAATQARQRAIELESQIVTRCTNRPC